MAGEGEAGGLEVELEVGGRYVGHVDGQVDEVLFGIDLGGALRPENCGVVSFVIMVFLLMKGRGDGAGQPKD